MKIKKNNELTKAKRTAGFYNMVPNLFWSILCLVPIFVFCYKQLDASLLYLFVGLSIFPAFLSNPFLDKIQIASKAATYKNLGVGLVQRLSQNGKIVNNIIRRKYPDYQVLRWDHESVKNVIKQTYLFEKFHLMLLVFYGLISIYAFYKDCMVWAILILLLNILYNVYPILMQQYIRLKLATYSGYYLRRNCD